MTDLNHPRFIVFTDPRPLDYDLLSTWHPPAHQEQLVRHLIESGFAPLVNSVKQLEMNEIKQMTAILLLDNMTMLRADQYSGQKVLCIQWYNCPLEKQELDTIMEYCAPFYGVGVAKSYITKAEQLLIDRGCMTPTQPRAIIQGSSFLGNHIKIVNGQLTATQ